MYQYQDGLIPPGQETFGAMPMPMPRPPPPNNFHHSQSPPSNYAAAMMPPGSFTHGSQPNPPAPPYVNNFQGPAGDYNDRPPPYFVQGEDFHQTTIIPPHQTSVAPSAPTLSEPTLRPSTVGIPPMAEEDVRHILETYVNSECCYGKDPVTQMNIRDISNLPVFRYQLETFTEKRVGTWKTVPYGGTDHNTIHGGVMTSGIPSNLWEYVAVPDVRFQKGKKVFELPGTTSICSCPRCQGSGRVQCSSCGGSGSTPCSSCSGMGHSMTTDTNGAMVNRPCTWCTGTGRSNCSRCHRRGVRTCSTCEGKFRVKTYYELQVIWNCTAEACVSVDGDLNSNYRKYFKRKGGFFRVASQTSTWAQPLDNFPDPGIQAASRSMLEGSVRGHQNSVQRIIEFRQTVLEVPCTIVRFTWKGKEDLFLISGESGTTNSVHFPNSYPQGCCSIL